MQPVHKAPLAPSHEAHPHAHDAAQPTGNTGGTAAEVAQRLQQTPKALQPALVAALQQQRGNAFVQQVVAAQGDAHHGNDGKAPVAIKPQFGLTKTAEGPAAVTGKGDRHPYDPNDVKQGGVGTCYVLASLASLAQHSPHVLAEGLKNNGDGTFNVRLFVRKSWSDPAVRPKDDALVPFTYRVTARFPLGSKELPPGMPFVAAHAQGGDRDVHGNRELWVKLYEKAWAMRETGQSSVRRYTAIEGGTPSQVLEAITGKEHAEFLVRESEDDPRSKRRESVRAKIIQSLAQHHAITASTFGNLDATEFANAHQLIGAHAYAVVAADEKQITVRNPWGGAKAVTELSWEQFYKYFRRTSMPGVGDYNNDRQ